MSMVGITSGVRSAFICCPPFLLLLLTTAPYSLEFCTYRLSFAFSYLSPIGHGSLGSQLDILALPTFGP